MARVITLSGLTCLSGTSPSLPAGFDYCQPPSTAQQVGAPVLAGDGWTYTKLADAGFPGVEYREYKNADGSEVYWLCGKPTSVKLVNLLLLGGVGAGLGYMTLGVKDPPFSTSMRQRRYMNPVLAAMVGAAVGVLPVLAFRKGGWFRKGA